ncbi:ABC transporter permease [Nocardioides jishulii]|uniref:ABC transporter permease n=1 Tax=Nocardioides jishulii TaxID=2575440 RepID=A0A4U2YT19_9ACTN|nr:ABC transporter permease [Nocardioides jishulii]QCX28479.1 ABC transporter permease [Nocardioides jishulii]TKI64628.1 ABC transporter permease [Nocardioides jishulii]
MRPVLTVAGMELKLFTRDRSNIFFVFVFPLFLVAMIGLQFGEGANAGRVAVVGGDGPLQERLVDQLERQDVVVSDPSWDDALTRLARGRLDVAVRVTAAAEEDAGAGRPVRLEVVRGSATSAQVAEQGLRAAVAAVRSEQAQVMALEERGVPAAEAQEALARARTQVAESGVKVISTDQVSEEFDDIGQYDFGAAGQLLLFVFLTTLTGATTMIQARRYGVVRRMLTAPVTSSQVIVGTVLGRWVLGLFQGAYIMAASSLLFGVQWGNLPTALVVLALFALVAAGAAILLGTLLENEGAAVGVGVGVGLVLAALGGSMFPLELFPDTMRTVANAVPHAWAYEALAEVQRRGGTVVDVLPELGVLAGMAVLLVGLGAWSLRRSLARAM